LNSANLYDNTFNIAKLKYNKAFKSYTATKRQTKMAPQQSTSSRSVSFATAPLIRAYDVNQSASFTPVPIVRSTKYKAQSSFGQSPTVIQKKFENYSDSAQGPGISEQLKRVSNARGRRSGITGIKSGRTHGRNTITASKKRGIFTKLNSLSKGSTSSLSTSSLSTYNRSSSNRSSSFCYRSESFCSDSESCQESMFEKELAETLKDAPSMLIIHKVSSDDVIESLGNSLVGQSITSVESDPDCFFKSESTDSEEDLNLSESTDSEEDLNLSESTDSEEDLNLSESTNSEEDLLNFDGTLPINGNPSDDMTTIDMKTIVGDNNADSDVGNNGGEVRF